MFFVYIMANRRNGAIYIGQTSDLAGRVWEHQCRMHKGFTDDWDCHRLVWFEIHETRESAFKRERRMKDWTRQWKIARIEALNPRWEDVSVNMTDAVMYDRRRKFVDAAHAQCAGPLFA